MTEISSINNSYQLSSKINSLVELSVSYKKKNIDLLYSKKSFLETKLSRISNLRTNFNSLKNNISNFTSYFNVLNSFKATSSDNSIAVVTATEQAITGSISLNIESVASNHKIASSSFSKSTNNIVSLEGSGNKNFSIVVNGESVNYDINILDTDTDYDILLKIKDTINSNSQSKVMGSIVQKNENEYVLVIEGKSTGSNNSINLVDNLGNLFKNTGFIDNNGNIINTLSQAQDAIIKVGDNFIITRSSNEIKDAIPGIVLNLKKTGSINVNIEYNDDEIINKLKDFVNSYNTLVSYIAKLIYEERDQTKPTSGVFYSDSTLKIVRDKIRSILFEKTDNISIFEIGFKNVDAKNSSKENSYNLNFDEAVFKNKLKENRDLIKKLLNSEDGVFKKLENYINSIINSSGLIDKLTESTNNNISLISKRIDFSQRMLNQSIEYYKALYSTLLSKVNSLQKNESSIINSYSKLF